MCLSLAERLGQGSGQDGLAGTSPIQASGPDNHGYTEIADEMMRRRSRELRMGRQETKYELERSTCWERSFARCSKHPTHNHILNTLPEPVEGWMTVGDDLL